MFDNFKNARGIATLLRRVNRNGFTFFEILCTVSIFWIIIVGILKIQQSFYDREKQIRTRAEMSQIANMLEEYYVLHGDYPKIIAHNDHQCDILCTALHGEINPDGDVPDEGKQIDLVTVSLKEINGRFTDPFLSDYIYYYKLRSDSEVWQNKSYILISKGIKGQQDAKRSVVVTKGSSVSTSGVIGPTLGGDIVLTNGGFL
jgi:type II secretory pathway pseudopilin PulG